MPGNDPNSVAGKCPFAALGDDDVPDSSGRAADPNGVAAGPAARTPPPAAAGDESTTSLPLTFAENGDVVKVPDEVKKAIQDHTFTAGWARTKNGKSAMQRSFIHQWGVYQERTIKNGAFLQVEREWRCKASERCRNIPYVVPCKDGNSGNVNKHLKKDHGICGSRSSKALFASNQQQVVDLVAQAGAQKITMGVSNARANEIAFMRLLVKEMLPFSLSTSLEFRVLMSVASKETFPTIGPKYVKHLMVEMYDATKKAMLEGLEAEQKRVCLKNLHFSPNIWTCKVSGKKYLGIHIFWVDEEFKLRSASVAVKHYSPAPDTESQMVSESLWKIFKASIAEFGLEVDQFASCTTDADSDVKNMAVKMAAPTGILWKWCDADLISKACEVAFGMSPEPRAIKNNACRDIISKVIEVVKTMSSSPTMRTRFEDIQVEEVEAVLNMVKHAPQPWLTLAKTLFRIILLWELLRLTYSKKDESFPLDPVMREILELYSLLEPCAKIMRQAQFSGMPVAGKMHSLIGLLIAKTLNPDKPLKVYMLPADRRERNEEGREGGRKGGEGDGQVELGGEIKKKGQSDDQGRNSLPSRDVSHGHLSDVAQETRMALREALVSRYAGRVWDHNTPDPLFFDDAQVFFTPSYSSSTFLNNFKLRLEDEEALPTDTPAIFPTRSDDVKERVQQAWKEIEARAVQAATKEAEQNAESSPPANTLFTAWSGEEWGSCSRKRRRLDENDEELAGMFPDACEEDDGDAVAIVHLVKAEINRYKSVREDPREMLLQDGLDYWAKTGRHTFSILRHVARQVFGMQASTAQIESDFSGAGQLLTCRRSRLDTHWVEMLLFLNANFDRIPAYIPAIPRGKSRDYLPKHFKGLDSELALAEDVIDPVEKDPDASVDPNFGLPVGEDDND